MALVWKEITDPQLAWILREEGQLHWMTTHGHTERYSTDAMGFCWGLDEWVEAYPINNRASGIYLEE